MCEVLCQEWGVAVDMTDKAHAPGVPGTDGQGVSAGMEHKGRAA